MSYSGDPSSSDRDAARFHVGDTDTTDEILLDAEYDYLLQTNGPIMAAAEACEAIASKYARKVDTTVGRASKSLSQRAEAYRRQAAVLRRRAAIGTASVLAGGISRDAKEAEEDRADRVEPAFRRNMHRHEGLVSDNEPE